MSEYQRIQKLNKLVCFQEQLEEQIVQNPREVIFHTVASMCDNKHLFKFKKATYICAIVTNTIYEPIIKYSVVLFHYTIRLILHFLPSSI